MGDGVDEISQRRHLLPSRTAKASFKRRFIASQNGRILEKRYRSLPEHRVNSLSQCVIGLRPHHHGVQSFDQKLFIVVQTLLPLRIRKISQVGNLKQVIPFRTDIEIGSPIPKELDQVGVGGSAVRLGIVQGDDIHPVSKCLSGRLRQAPRQRFQKPARICRCGFPRKSASLDVDGQNRFEPECAPHE
jgi:hypothetical protein